MDDLSSDALPLTDWHGVQPKSYCRMCWHDKTNELVCPEQDGFSYLEDRYLDWRGQLVKRERVTLVCDGGDVAESTDWVDVHPRKRQKRTTDL